MALKPKNPDQAPSNGATPAAAAQPASTAANAPLEFRNDPRIDAGIAEYKKAHPRDTEYFTRLVKENPERAINFHFREKWERHVADTEAAAKQIPRAESIYNNMTPDSKARVDEALAKANPYNHTKGFVAAVNREMDRLAIGNNRRMMRTPVPGATAPAVAAG